MIVLRSVTKHIGRWRYGKRVLDDVNAVFPAKTNWVIFGGAESGKTTLLNILCGAVAPTRGSVEAHGLVGLPVGSNVPLGFYDTAQTVATRTARLFHANVEDVLKFTDDFTGLGSRIKRPLNELSAAQRAEFNFALGYALPLDFYLFDMTYGPTGEPMRSSCLAAFKQRK